MRIEFPCPTAGSTPVGVGTTAGREVRSQLSPCPKPILLYAKIALKMKAGRLIEAKAEPVPGAIEPKATLIG